MSATVPFPVSFLTVVLLLALYLLENGKRSAIDGAMRLEESSRIISTLVGIAKVLCWIPILATLGVILWDDIPRRKKLRNHPLYDSDEKILKFNDSSHLPFLPDKDYCSEEEYTMKLVDIEIKRLSNMTALEKITFIGVGGDGALPKIKSPHSNTSWALVTGASQGIGRAICVSLARRRIPLVVVARNRDKLESLAKELMTNYGVLVIPMRCDLSQPESIDELMEKLKTCVCELAPSTNENANERLIDKIDILINNAGLGNSCRFFGNAENDATEKMIHLNVLGTTKLTQLLGRHMKHNDNNKTKSGRIVVVSSIMGTFPGAPGCAVYAATKAFQRSLCASLGDELERDDQSNSNSSFNSRPIAVVCVLPGAVAETGFASASHMTESAIFHLLPGCGLTLTPQQVAEATVKAAISGTKREVVVGWIYILTANLSKILPDRLMTILAGLAMRHKQTFEFQSMLGGLFSKMILSNGDDKKTKKNA